MTQRMSFAICLYLLLVGVGRGSDASMDSFVFWETKIESSSFAEVAAAFEATGTPKWPNSDREPSKSDKVRHLSRLLHEKLRAQMSPMTELSSDTVRALSIIGGALNRAGGYTNLLLADSFSRIALYQTSKWAVEGSGRNLIEVKDLNAGIPMYPVILPDLLKLLATQDKTVQARANVLDTTTPSETLFAIAQKLGPEAQNSLARALAPGGQKFTVLLDNPSALGLSTRLAGTELFHRVSLTALIIFLERGGTREELNPADITAFKKRMHGMMKSFAYSPLGLKTLSVENPLSMFELHNDPEKQKAFLQIALE